MEDLNNVPSSGTYGAAINEVNANFSLIVNAINSLEYATTKSKGIYNNGFTPNTTTLPNSVSGDWCMVLGTGNTFPATIWTYNGTTWAQGGTWNPDGINLNDYATTTALTTAVANSLLQATARMGYGEATASNNAYSVTIANYTLPTNGGVVRVKMPAAATGAATLNITDTGAKTIWYNGAAVSSQNTWEAQEIISVYYDGTNYQATNSQGGGGKAEKIKYDNSQSGLSAENVQGALDEAAETALNVKSFLADVTTSVYPSNISTSSITSAFGSNVYSYNYNNVFKGLKVYGVKVASPGTATLNIGVINLTNRTFTSVKQVQGNGSNTYFDVLFDVPVQLASDEVIGLHGRVYYGSSNYNGCVLATSVDGTSYSNYAVSCFPLQGEETLNPEVSNKVLNEKIEQNTSDISRISSSLDEVESLFSSDISSETYSSCTNASDNKIYGQYFIDHEFYCKKIRIKVINATTLSILKVTINGTSATTELIKTATFSSAGVYDVELDTTIKITSTTQIAIQGIRLGYAGGGTNGFQISNGTISSNTLKFGYGLYELYSAENIIDMANGYSARPSGGYENFSVSVNYYEENLASNASSVNDTAHYYTDYGAIALPSNYTPSKPTRLVILCGGTEERIAAATNPMNYYGWSYLMAKGYAVMDMNGMSSSWGTDKGLPIKGQHFASKYLLESYRKGLDYCKNKYNLYPEVFIMGISMGGGAMAMLVQSGMFNVLAACGFCPALSCFKHDYMNPWLNATNQRKTIAGQWGFDNWGSASTFDINYFVNNISKVGGYENLLANTFGSQEDKDTANSNYGNTAEATAYNNLSKYFPCPIKIWHAADDVTVLPRYSQFFVNMINNGGGKAFMRNIASGAHVAGWNCGEATDTDINGDTITTSVNFKEACLFIHRYEL